MLSPTASAIVQAFKVLSSFIYCLCNMCGSTFPTKSALISADLAKIPPPTLPKKAIVEVPRPNPAIEENKTTDDLSSSFHFKNTAIKTNKTNTPMEIIENPTTTPAWKAALKPSETL